MAQDYAYTKSKIISEAQAAARLFLQATAKFNEANNLFNAIPIDNTGAGAKSLLDTDFVGAFTGIDRATFVALLANLATWAGGGAMNMTTLNNQMRLLIGDPTAVV